MKSTHFRYARSVSLPASSIAAALLIASGVGWPTSAAGAEPLTPRDLTGIQSVGTVRISPDGAHIALTKFIPRDPYKERSKQDGEFEDGWPFTELHVLRLSDGRDMPFVTGRKSVGSIAWTPDGNSISFLAKRGDDKHRSLYVIPLHGGEARRVLAHETRISAYSWSPDGRRVAFLAKDKEPKEEKKLKKKGFKAEVFEENIRFTRLWIADIEDDDAEPRMLDLEGNVSVQLDVSSPIDEPPCRLGQSPRGSGNGKRSFRSWSGAPTEPAEQVEPENTPLPSEKSRRGAQREREVAVYS